jgi:hypothetical protein
MAFDNNTLTASINFQSSNEDRFVLRSRFDGIASTANPNDLVIKVSVTNKITNEVISWEGAPTSLR